MVLKELSDKLYPTFIQKFAETASDLCRLFLSASSMKEKAVVRHVVCDTPEQAWTTALTALQEALEKNNIEPTILRADWVTTRESTTWEDCLNQISARRRNWFFKGIALDKEYRLAFLRQELNANINDLRKVMQSSTNHGQIATISTVGIALGVLYSIFSK